jgi:hypothetical protein
MLQLILIHQHMTSTNVEAVNMHLGGGGGGDRSPTRRRARGDPGGTHALFNDLSKYTYNKHLRSRRAGPRMLALL